MRRNVTATGRSVNLWSGTGEPVRGVVGWKKTGLNILFIHLVITVMYARPEYNLNAFIRFISLPLCYLQG